MAALTTEQKLAEANAALHSLVTGTMARVFVDQNGERVEFTMTTVSQLRAYIAELNGLLAGSINRGPIGFMF